MCTRVWEEDVHQSIDYPRRIISLEPGVTATLLALGQRARLVGDDAIADLPRVPCTWSGRATDLLPIVTFTRIRVKTHFGG